MKQKNPLTKEKYNPKDWPEDFAHENGEYYCRCYVCNETFTGYKRRVICKECANKNQKSED